MEGKEGFCGYIAACLLSLDARNHYGLGGKKKEGEIWCKVIDVIDIKVN